VNSTMAYLRSRRSWLVENLSVWGSDTEAEFVLAAAETVGADLRVGFWPVSLGGQVQEISFSTLVDNRGNHLPAAIKRPAVVVIARGRRSAYIKSINGETGFMIVRSDSEGAPVGVDLMVFETGL
jgi:hypothetical protein